jgi:hypothetical protein
VSPVLLEVDEPPGEDEDVTLTDDLGEELVGGGDEADLERALQDEDDLGGARMRVRRVLAARGIVDARDGDTQGVHAGELLHVGRRHHGARRVVGVARVPQPREEEVVRRHVRLAREPVQLDRYKTTHRSAASNILSAHKGGKKHETIDRLLTGGEVSDADVLEHVRVAGECRGCEREHDGAGRGHVEVDLCHGRSFGTGATSRLL